MNLDDALHDLTRALDEQGEPNAERRIRAARQLLVARGVEVLGIDHSTNVSLSDVIRMAVEAPQTPARRAYAVLLVHALGVDGLVVVKSSRGQFDRDICSFLETALPTVLQRSGYNFSDETYEKRRLLERLHAAIDELMKPLEPTFPPNVRGLYAG
jgi:hypothetical protein